MNIIEHRQNQRKDKINLIKKSLKKSEKFKNKDIDKKEMILFFCMKLNISKRTASEYLDIAIYDLLKNEPK